jgi:hypothetical protein
MDATPATQEGPHFVTALRCSTLLLVAQCATCFIWFMDTFNSEIPIPGKMESRLPDDYLLRWAI